MLSQGVKSGYIRGDKDMMIVEGKVVYMESALGYYTCRGAVTICKSGKKGRFLNMLTSLVVSQDVFSLYLYL